MACLVSAINSTVPSKGAYTLLSVGSIAIPFPIAVIGSIILVQIVGFGEESEEVKEDIIKEVATTLLDNNKEIKNLLVIYSYLYTPLSLFIILLLI